MVFSSHLPPSLYELLPVFQPIPIPAQNGPVLFYHMTYTNMKTQKSSTRRVTQDTTSLTIFGLSPWRHYSVTIKGENSIGFSPASTPVTELTLPIGRSSYKNTSAFFFSSHQKAFHQFSLYLTTEEFQYYWLIFHLNA